ncbi:uncharacterized protein [Nicotiana tomentosiformis]|uniref:uncharacterized protein n=1 Tax=Nicotiana tomentosiformis TaxID=4098 RepID=UPI00388CDF8C
MLTRDREEREAKRSRESGTYSGTRAQAAVRHGRGSVSRPVHSALSAASDILAPSKPQDPYYAPPMTSIPPTRGAFSGKSSRPGPSQSQQPRSPRAYFEYGDTRHMVRDCPRLRRGAPLQTSHPLRAPPCPQAIIPAPTTSPLAQLARGGGQGCPRGGGYARYYALPARTEAVVSDSVITGIVLVFHRDASVLFDPSSTYSYVSSYFAPYLGISRDSLSFPVYVSTNVEDSLVVNCMYRSCLIALSSFETKDDLLLLNSVGFLRHVLSSDGINVDTKKVGAVQSYPRPSSAMEIRNFLGLAGYYHLFVEGLSSIETPMTRTTQKGAPFRWTEKCGESEVQEKFDYSPVLVLPTANVVDDALSHRTESLWSLAYLPTIERLLALDVQALASQDTFQNGNAKMVTIGDDGALRMQGKLCVPNVDGLRDLILQEAHSPRYSIYLGVAKMY